MRNLNSSILSDIVVVIWSFQRGDIVLSIVLEEWIKYSEKIGITLFIATDSEEMNYLNKILFTKSNWKDEWL